MTLVQAPQPPTPIVPAVVAAQNIKSRLTDFWAEAVATYRQCYNQFWFDPNGAAPQDIAAQLGTDAANLHQVSSALYAIIVQAAGSAAGVPATVPTGWTWVDNPDGTATLTQQT